VRAIRRLIRDRAIDLVQLGGLVNPHAAIAARQEDIPVVWRILDTRPPMALRRIMMPLVLRLSDVVMTTGRAVAEVHPGAAGLGERVRPFYPPVDPDVFSAEDGDRDSARAELGFAPEDVVLVSVGNLNPQKGHEDLIRAAALLRRTTPHIKLLIAAASHPDAPGLRGGPPPPCRRARP
jgi:glycosyltransferase involved in cell wall biosynthesis